MRIRIVLSILCFLLILPSGAALAAIVLTPGDIGASYPDVMVNNRKGLFMPRSEAYVFSGTNIPYPEDLIGATSLQVSLYFITETTIPGEVRMRCWLDSYNTGDPYNVGGYMDDPPAVPVAGETAVVYKQVFTFETIPPVRELFSLGISRNTYNGDTYQDGIYLHAIRFEVDSATPVQDSTAPPVRDLHLCVDPNPFNPATKISFVLPMAGLTTVEIYDLKGRLLQTLLAGESLGAGPQEILWTPEGVASGTYLIRVETAGLVETLKVGLIK